MTTFRFTVYGTPQPAGSKRALLPKGRRYPNVVDANPKSRDWKREVASAAAEAFGARDLLDGPLRVAMQFFRARPKGHYGKRGLRPAAPRYVTTRPDVLKLARAVEDACTGVIWIDDAQIVLEVIRKRWADADGRERVEIEVVALA